MTESEQKKIFATNLAWYVSCSGKSQKEVASDLSINEKTFNGWCKGVSIPKAWTIQKVADYFNIPKSRLLDAWEAGGRIVGYEIADRVADDSIRKYLDLSDADRQMVNDMISRLHDGAVG